MCSVAPTTCNFSIENTGCTMAKRIAPYSTISAAAANSTSETRFNAGTLSHMRGLQNAQHQIVEGDTTGARRYRHQTVIGHAGDGVHFQKPRAIFRVEHQIKPPPALTTDDAKRGYRLQL